MKQLRECATEKRARLRFDWYSGRPGASTSELNYHRAYICLSVPNSLTSRFSTLSVLCVTSFWTVPNVIHIYIALFPSLFWMCFTIITRGFDWWLTNSEFQFSRLRFRVSVAITTESLRTKDESLVKIAHTLSFAWRRLMLLIIRFMFHVAYTTCGWPNWIAIYMVYILFI